MPTLLQDCAPAPAEVMSVEEFDLERLALLSEAPPAVAAPRCVLLEPAPAQGFRPRRMLAVALLAAAIVCTLATLRPNAGLYAAALVPQGVTTTSGACSVGD